MLRWSTWHQMPAGWGSRAALSTRIGDNIFLVLAANPANFAIFDTATETFNFLKCEIDGQIPEYPRYFWLGSYENMLYMWSQGSDFPAVVTLWQMDIKKLKWEKNITHVRINECQYGECVVIGDNMYMLGEDPTKFYVLNLLTKEVSDFIVTGSHNNGHIMVNDDKIYVIQQNGLNRIVSILKSSTETFGKLEVIHEETIGRLPKTRYNNGMLCKTDKYSFDVFDFKLLQWNSVEIEKPHIFEKAIDQCYMINDKLYLILGCHYFEPQGTRIKVLELIPKLETICYMTFFDAILKEKDEVRRKEVLDKTMERLSFSEKPGFECLINWRLAKTWIFGYQFPWLEGVGWVPDRE